MFVDVILLNVFLDLFYRMNSMCFADHLNSLLLTFCSFSFIFFPIVSFCSYVILMYEKNHMIQKSVKSDSNPKHFSFFVFYFKVSRVNQLVSVKCTQQ